MREIQWSVAYIKPASQGGVGECQRAAEEETHVSVMEFRWASETCANGMLHPQELAYLDYKPVIRNGEMVRDPRYPETVLMVRDGT